MHASLADPATRSPAAESDAAIMAPLFHKPGFLLARIDQIATSLHAARLPSVTPSQCEALLVLAALGTVPQSAVARAIGLDKSTTGLVLDNLEARDLVGRSLCSEDRRRAQVSLSGAGTRAVVALRAGFDALQGELVAALSPGAGARFVALLARLGGDPRNGAPAWQPAGVLDAVPSVLCRRALQHLQAAFAQAVAPSRATLRQFSLLFILSRRSAISQIGFARLYGLDPSTCAVILRALTKRGLLSPHPSTQDRRERLYRLTASGRTALVELQARAERSERAALAQLSPDEVRWLVDELRRIVAAYSDRLRFPGLFPDDLVTPSEGAGAHGAA